MKYEIYQLKEDTMEQVKLRFMASDQAAALGGIHRENYQRTYTGEMKAGTDSQRALDSIYTTFNVHRPKEFTGHSLSVSDVVRLGDEWWYCDPYGWMEPNREEWGQT